MHTCSRLKHAEPDLALPNESYESLQSTSGTSVSSIFKLSQMSSIIASFSAIAFFAHLLLSSLESVRNVISLRVGRALNRTIPHALGLVLFISVSVSFLALLGLSSAFKKDLLSCNTGPCQSISGSSSFEQTSDSIVSESAWAPQAGCFVMMAAAFISLLAVCLVATNRDTPTQHSDSPSDEQDLQPMIELTSNTELPSPSPSLSDPRARAALFVVLAVSALATAVIVWACTRPQCATCASNTLQVNTNVLEGVVESIEMQVLPTPPTAWPSLKDGLSFYQKVLSSLSAATELGLDFDSKPHDERVVTRFLWQTVPMCETSNCSLRGLMSNVRYRQVVSGSGYGSSDFTMKQNRRFRQNAATLTPCITTAERVDCKAKIEANYFWKFAGSSDVDITWQRSCTLRLQSTSPAIVTPPVIRSVRDVLPFFSSAAAAFVPHSENTTLFQSSDCFHESDYKARIGTTRISLTIALGFASCDGMQQGWPGQRPISVQFEFKWPLDAPPADFDRVDAIAQRLRQTLGPK